MDERGCSLGLTFALLAVIAIAAGLPQGPPPASAQDLEEPASTAFPAGLWEVSATPTSDLVDGQKINVNVKSPQDVNVLAVHVQVCRTGVDFQPSTKSQPNVDFALGGLNCPASALSSSADARVISNDTLTTTKRPEGATIGYRVGTGQVAWTSGTDPQTLACDTDNPCALVVEVRGGPVGQVPSWVPWVSTLEYRDEDLLAGCGGAADGSLLSGGSDRMSEAWIQWTRAACQLPGQSGALTRSTFTGEGPAVRDFASGVSDLAYSAVGYTEGVGFLDETEGEPRASVATPLAVNATVLAVANGYQGSDGRPLPYSDIKLTQAEVAGLVGGGPSGVTPYLGAIYARNPQLASSGFFDTNAAVQLTGPAEEEGTSFLLSRSLATLAPEAWVVPNNPALFGSEAGLPRGIVSSLGTATPSFNNAITLYSGRPVLRKNLYGSVGPGAIWVVTDLNTAHDLDLYPVAIENADGAFVQPNADSLAAAADTIDTSVDEPWVADPTLTGTGDVQPYPLTFVEYALAPAEPLRNVDCSPREVSQALLTTWLEFLTGPAQASLPGGMVGLTPALAEQAKASIARVGASETTGECAGWTPEGTEVPPPGGQPTPGSGAGGSSSGGFPSSLAGLPGSSKAAAFAAVGGPGGLGDLAETATLAAAAGGQRPGYGGSQLTNILLTLGSFVLIALITAYAALQTSGWRPRRFGGRSTGTGS